MVLFPHSGLVFALCVSLLYTTLVHRVISEPTQDKEALISFITLTPLAKRIQWNLSDSACTWTGVTCDSNRSYVSALRLPAAGLVGSIPVNTLGRLSQLRILSLRSNRFSGQIPADFSNLNLLKNLYLQDNLFSGNFPTPVVELTRLTRLDLSSNSFSGSIPFTINNLAQLKGLFLQNNRFSGNLPSINSLSLTELNVSNNNLNGSIPKSIQKFPRSAFAGNLNLCGGPLPECNQFLPSPTPPSPSSINPSFENKSNKLSKSAIIAIAVCSVLFCIILLLVLFFCFRKQNQNPVARSLGAIEGGERIERDENKLVNLGRGGYSFDAETLLRAPSEVLGRGDNGVSYKTVVAEGATVVVVKRLNDVAASKSEFRAQMHVLGKTKHENVVPLKAYFFF